MGHWTDSIKFWFGFGSREWRMEMQAKSTGETFFGATPVAVTHPNIDPKKIPFKIWFLAPSKGRPHAMYMTTGLKELKGVELLCLVRDSPTRHDDDKFAWLLAGVGCYPEELGFGHTLPLTPSVATALMSLRLPIYELTRAFIGTSYNCEEALQTLFALVCPISSAEHEYAIAHSTEALFAKLAF